MGQQKSEQSLAGESVMTHPAAPESETPETDALIANIEAGKTKLLSGPGLTAAISFLEPEVLEKHARSLERRLSLAQTEIKGHMRVTRETIERAEKALQDCEMYKGWIGRLRADAAQAQARIAALEKELEILRGKHGSA